MLYRWCCSAHWLLLHLLHLVLHLWKIITFFLFFLFTLLVNSGLGLIHPRLRLYPQELMVVYLMATIACSIAKAGRELGYRPEISLEEGMRRSIAWCLANGIALQ